MTPSISLTEWYLVRDCPGISREHILEVRDRAIAQDLSPYDLALFRSIWYDYGHVSDVDVLMDNAYGWYRKTFAENAEYFTKRCIERGWIAKLTSDFLREQSEELEQKGYLIVNGLLGACGFPEDALPGIFSFTVLGAAAFHQWECTENASCWKSQSTGVDVDEMTIDFFGTTPELCRSWYSTGEMEYDEPTAIGRWCDRWWQRFESGFRVRGRFRSLENEPE
jgi:hypothetical protein